MSIIPSLMPVWIAEVICEVLPSRIMLPMAGEAKRISSAATRPPPILRHELLRDDGADRFAEDVADAFLLAGGEDADDAVHRLRGVVRVQRAEDERAALGGGERHGDRLEVAHLADQDDVRDLRGRLLSAPRRTTSRACRSRADG